MYGKIFDTIYNGTLADDWRALVTFQQMIVLCDADGVIDMTPAALSRHTSIPIEHIKAGIEILESEDPYSRTPGEGGRRIVRLDEHRPWGWYLVNHEKYKSLQDADTVRAQNRERKRKQRERSKESRTVTDGHAPSRHTDTDTDTDTKKKKGQRVDRFPDFWGAYPKKRKKKPAREIWKRKKLDIVADNIVLDVLNRLENDGQWDEGFIPDPTTYLNQERWEDELAPKKGRDGKEQEALPPRKPGETDAQYRTRLVNMQYGYCNGG